MAVRQDDKMSRIFRTGEYHFHMEGGRTNIQTYGEALMVFGFATFCAIKITRWTWYFMLRRIAELAVSIRAK